MANGNDISNNRFLRLSRPQQLLIVVALCAALFVMFECLAWLGLYSMWQVSGRSIIPVEYISAFRPFSEKSPFVSQSEYRPYYMYSLRPNIDITRRTPFGTDRHGLMINHPSQAERDLNVASGAYRIFLFGNSTIMGEDSGTSLAAQLELVLNAGSTRRFEVITAGADGFNSGQELARLSLETVHLHPNMIITLDGVSDAFSNSFNKNSAPNSHIHAEVLKHSLRESAQQNKSFVEVNVSSADLFLRRFYSYHILLAVFSKVGLETANSALRADQSTFGRTLVDTLVYRPEGARVYIGNLELISAVGKTRGFPTLHFLQPTIATELLERGDSSSDAEWSLLEKPQYKQSYTRQKRAEVFSKFYNSARFDFERLARTQNKDLVRWVDLSQFFSNVDDLTSVYKDAMHYHSNRIGELAEEIARHVRRELAAD